MLKPTKGIIGDQSRKYKEVSSFEGEMKNMPWYISTGKRQSLHLITVYAVVDVCTRRNDTNTSVGLIMQHAKMCFVVE